MKVATSTPYVAARPIVAISTPAMAGPATMPIVMRNDESAPAAAISLRSTRRGVSASSDGRWSPSSIAMTAASTKMTQSRGSREERVHEQGGRRACERELGDLHHPAAVDGVGDRASDQGAPQERHELDGAQEADDERRVADLVGLERERDVGDHRAQERDPLADEEQAEVAVPPERPDVHRGHCEQPAGAGRLDRRAGPEPLGLSLALVEVVLRHGRAGYARGVSRRPSDAAECAAARVALPTRRLCAYV